MSILAFFLAIYLGSASSHHTTAYIPHQHVQPADSLGQQGGG
jgi:hypothetical protein